MALEFEKPVLELETKITELEVYAKENGQDMESELEFMRKRLDRLRVETFDGLSRWQRVQLARVAGRPTALDYFTKTFSHYRELHGDRAIGEDGAIVGGLARLEGRAVVVIGQQKGRDTKENISRNFGMSHPEGFRKAMRLMDLAEKFQLPIVTLVDTPGAYPGIASEERGIAWVIAQSIQRMTSLKVPVISAVIGEGGSGGAIAIAVANKVLILENAVYSVISPESCAVIAWKDVKEAEKAAEALRLTAKDLLEFDIVDAIVPEPKGGAHNDLNTAAEFLKTALLEQFKQLDGLSVQELLGQRAARFRKLGAIEELA